MVVTQGGNVVYIHVVHKTMYSVNNVIMIYVHNPFDLLQNKCYQITYKLKKNSFTPKTNKLFFQNACLKSYKFYLWQKGCITLSVTFIYARLP